MRHVQPEGLRILASARADGQLARECVRCCLGSIGVSGGPSRCLLTAAVLRSDDSSACADLAGAEEQGYTADGKEDGRRRQPIRLGGESDQVAADVGFAKILREGRLAEGTGRTGFR